MRRIKGQAAILFGAVGLFVVSGPLKGDLLSLGNDPASLSASGTFAYDNNEQYFTFSIDEPGVLTVQTTSFAVGGFAPDLTLFDADTGDYITFDDGGTAPGGCASRVIASEGCLDALIDQTLFDTANYVLILTESGNQALGDLSDGFYFDRNNNPCAPDRDFTNSGCLDYGPGPGGFYLPDGTRQTSDWALFGSFTASAPEPASFVLFALGLTTGILSERRSQARSGGKKQIGGAFRI